MNDFKWLSDAIHFFASYMTQSIALCYLILAFGYMLGRNTNVDAQTWARQSMRIIVICALAIACAAVSIATVTLYGR